MRLPHVNTPVYLSYLATLRAMRETVLNGIANMCNSISEAHTQGRPESIPLLERTLGGLNSILNKIDDQMALYIPENALTPDERARLS